ncbi:uncharacterized protein DUF2742 [Mumia flava]|uniref:Uncharacterized protein DUF2742 n=1 Tax=Mumia flava TaxID=1348852 RepID=A0A0B2BT36_9ACTN|nr:DUF2742 domain-containing protein [Mumia flava]PJJ48309.1 uncharacterized protein DUF2742 [Mumia flava]
MTAPDRLADGPPYVTFVNGRKLWARQLVDKARGMDIPRYGSEAWCLLEPRDPAKIAAVVVAAEAWAQQDETLADDLRKQLDDLRRAYKAGEDDAYADRIADHCETWAPVTQSTVVPFAERRRRQLEAAKPRPGDHPGGPVEW